MNRPVGPRIDHDMRVAFSKAFNRRVHVDRLSQAEQEELDDNITYFLEALNRRGYLLVKENDS